jgi:hypothetical protein
MKKLTLELDALRVESFETGDAAGPRGTVRGAAVTPSACPTDAYDCDPNTQGGSCVARCTSCKWAAADAAEQPGGASDPLCQDPSYVQTCLFYTCGGCTTADPAYCPPQDA